VTSALRDLLPKRLSLTVIGELGMDKNASLTDVLEATQKLAEAYERDSEQQIVKEVATSAAKTRQAVVGLGTTLRRVNECRVWQLIYSEDFQCPGFECTKCAALFSISSAEPKPWRHRLQEPYASTKTRTASVPEEHERYQDKHRNKHCR
jgi:hypothetical protein